ncbi:MAG: hypothetical protein ACRDLS_07030, partial [Solirubrobacteraceae bacterium]
YYGAGPAAWLAAEAPALERAERRAERAKLEARRGEVPARQRAGELRSTPPPSRPVSTLPRERVARHRVGADRLPSEFVVGLVLLLIAMTAAALLVLGVLRVAVAG